MTLLMQVTTGTYNRPNVVFPVVGVTVMLLLGAFLMHDSHTTHRWIRFGTLSFQPSEIAKPRSCCFSRGSCRTACTRWKTCAEPSCPPRCPA